MTDYAQLSSMFMRANDESYRSSSRHVLGDGSWIRDDIEARVTALLSSCPPVPNSNNLGGSQGARVLADRDAGHIYVPSPKGPARGYGRALFGEL